MIDSLRCPACGGSMHADTRAGVGFHRCLACGAALLASTGLDAVLPPPPRPSLEPSEHDYPVHYPQDDRGHAASRPQPAFAPGWSSARPLADPDGADARRLLFGE